MSNCDWSQANCLSPTVQLDFSWTLKLSDQQNDRFARPFGSLSSSPCATWQLPEALSKPILSKWMNFYTNHTQKKLVMILMKIACFFKLFRNQRLESFCQLFSWTSVRPSKCRIDKMIGSQGRLRVWAIPWMPCVLSENSFTKIFLRELFSFSFWFLFLLFSSSFVFDV